MLDGLNHIAWKKLQHAYGPADDVPDLIRGLASKDAEVRDSSLSELFGNIWHQRTVCEATAYAVPFLVELACTPTVQGRADVLGLLAMIAESTDGPRTAHAAVVACASEVLSLLDDDEALVRASAGYTAGWLKEVTATVGPALRAATDREPDDLAGAGMLLGLRALEDTSAENLAWLGRRFARATHDRERVAVALAIAHAAREATPGPVIELLARACGDAGANSTRFEGLPWNLSGETLPGDALIAAGDAAYAGLPIILAAARDTDDLVDADFAVGDALAIAFRGRWIAQLPVKLSDPQRVVLQAIAELGALWNRPNLFDSTLESHQLPTTRRALIALLAERA